jgi:hypothetical protein
VRTIKPEVLQPYTVGQGTPKLWDSTPEVKAINTVLPECLTSEGIVASGRNKSFAFLPENFLDGLLRLASQDPSVN